MIELGKMRTLTTKNFHNLGDYCIIEISLILHYIYFVSRDQNKVLFYVNNYINWDQLNQLYNLN